jgi:hypothetical protein
MAMTSKIALFAVAVVVLMGSMAVSALASDQGMNLYARADSAFWPASDHQFTESEAVQSGGAEIREPMETGAVPDRSESSSNLGLNSGSGEKTVEYGGLQYRPDIDLGP